MKPQPTCKNMKNNKTYYGNISVTNAGMLGKGFESTRNLPRHLNNEKYLD